MRQRHRRRQEVVPETGSKFDPPLLSSPWSLTWAPQREERTHDDKIASASARIKQAGILVESLKYAQSHDIG